MIVWLAFKATLEEGVVEGFVRLAAVPDRCRGRSGL